MPGRPPSARFSQIYHSLPPEAQQRLVERHLIKLLDAVPKDRALRAVTAARTSKTRVEDVPVLDLKGKTKEIDYIFEEIGRNARRSVLKEEDHREELLDNLVDALTSWLSDIWSIVYEHHTNYAHAHSCLLLTASFLFRLEDYRAIGSCKCALMNVPVDVTIKNRRGKTVKFFPLTGTMKLDTALLWIWRELFVSLLSRGTSKETEKIPSMLDDIEGIFGWRSLERLLYGGKTLATCLDEDDDTNSDDEVDDECDEDDPDCACDFHASHWSPTINEQHHNLRKIVLTKFHSIFDSTPNHLLYNVIGNLSRFDGNVREVKSKLNHKLLDLAAVDTDSLIIALHINMMEHNHRTVRTLLENHSFLLRPRDWPILSMAVATLCDVPGYQAFCLQVAEKEILDTLTTIKGLAQSAFRNMDVELHRRELTEILKLASGSEPRKKRIESWVEAISAGSNNPMNPMAFAAAMFGLGPANMPVPPDFEPDMMDPIDMLDLDLSDPDLVDLGAELRPKLKDRFGGWTTLAGSMKGGKLLLVKLYPKVVEALPYMKGADVVEEMVQRLNNRSSKLHVADALVMVSSYCKVQRKKILLKDQKRKKEEASHMAALSALPFPLHTVVPPSGNSGTSPGTAKKTGSSTLKKTTGSTNASGSTSNNSHAAGGSSGSGPNTSSTPTPTPQGSFPMFFGPPPPPGNGGGNGNGHHHGHTHGDSLMPMALPGGMGFIFPFGPFTGPPFGPPSPTGGSGSGSSTTATNGTSTTGASPSLGGSASSSSSSITNSASQPTLSSSSSSDLNAPLMSLPFPFGPAPPPSGPTSVSRTSSSSTSASTASSPTAITAPTPTATGSGSVHPFGSFSASPFGSPPTGETSGGSSASTSTGTSSNAPLMTLPFPFGPSPVPSPAGASSSSASASTPQASTLSSMWPASMMASTMLNSNSTAGLGLGASTSGSGGSGGMMNGSSPFLDGFAFHFGQVNGSGGNSGDDDGDGLGDDGSSA